MYSIGIDIGYTAVKISILDSEYKLIYSVYRRHKGNIIKTVQDLVSEISETVDFDFISYGAFTGRGAMFLEAENSSFSEINMIAALIEGVKWERTDAESIIEIGGQSSRYITGISGRESNISVESNSDCAAGTGSFLEEQISRLNYDIEDYSSLIKKRKKYSQNCRKVQCFCKNRYNS